MSTIIIFILVIVVLVVAHELGHFLTAKAFGVKVEEFGIGYPPRAKRLFHWKGTLFTLNWLPFGGFVKIFGEESSSTDDPTSFARQKMWKRLLIIAAGVIANMVLAMVLYAISFSYGFLGTPEEFPKAELLTPPMVMVTSLVPGGPAEEAGMQPGDSIVSIETGKTRLEPHTTGDLTAFIREHSKKELSLVLRTPDGVERTVVATPREGVTNSGAGLGITILEAARLKLSFMRSLGVSVGYTLGQFKDIIVSIGMILGGLFSGGSSVAGEVSGPIGIAQFAGQAFAIGAGAFLSFMALISIYLAVINLLPFPALDGGRLILELFASSDGRSRIPARVVAAINQVGFILLILIMLYVTYRDIAKLVA